MTPYSSVKQVTNRKPKASEIIEAIDGLDDEDCEILDKHPAIRQILPQKRRDTARRSSAAVRTLTTRARPPKIKNQDAAVLRKEAQVPTHITPLIYQFSQGYFSEEVMIIGNTLNPRDPEPTAEDTRRCIWNLMQRHSRPRKLRTGRLVGTGPYLTYIKIDDVKYEVPLSTNSTMCFPY